METIKLIIVSASGLKATDSNGKSDPYVKFLWRGAKHKTDVVRNSVNPTWNKTFLISYEEGKDPSNMRLEVWDKDTLGPNDPLGQVILNLSTFQSGVSDQWYPLDKLDGVRQGKLRVIVESAGKHQTNTQHQQQTPQYGIPAQPPQTGMPPHQFPNGGWNGMAQNNSPTKSVVDEIQRILPGQTAEEIKVALGRFDGNKEQALAYLINNQISLLVQNQANHVRPPPSHAVRPAPGAYPQKTTLQNYTVAYNPHGASLPQYEIGVLGLKQAAQVVADPAVVYAGEGRRKALLIGINYLNTKKELRGSIQDVQRMKQVLVGIYGFPDIPEAIVTLTDDASDPKFQPTRKNILHAMRWLVQDAKPGDVFFFHFSGYGGQKPNYDGTEEDGMDEIIVPCDYKKEGFIVDNEIHALLVQPLPSGSRLTAIMDCCSSGTGMDLPFVWDDDRNEWEEEYAPYYSQGDVQLFSACADWQESGTGKDYSYGAYGGAMTIAFISAVMANPWGHTYPSLLDTLRRDLAKGGLKKQSPQLTASQKFSINRPFNLTDIVPNQNQMLGRNFIKNKKKKSKEHYVNKVMDFLAEL